MRTLDRQQQVIAAELERLTLARAEESMDFAALYADLFLTCDEEQLNEVDARIYRAAASARGTVTDG